MKRRAYATVLVRLGKRRLLFCCSTHQRCRHPNAGRNRQCGRLQLTAICDFMVHFELTPEVKLQFLSFGEETEGAIFEKAYPLLDDLFHSDKLSDAIEPTARDLALIRAMVAKQRTRLQGKK